MTIVRGKANALATRSGALVSSIALLVGCSPGSGEGPSDRTEPVVWGAFDVVEFEGAQPPEQEWATAVGILMRNDRINRLRGDGTPKNCPDKQDNSFECTAVLQTVNNGLCDNEPLATPDYSEQRSIDDSCTAFMIRSNVFATAAHCIIPEGTSTDSCSQRSVVLRWRRSLPNFPGGNTNVLEQHIYQCVEARRGKNATIGGPNDWAVFKVDRSVTGGGVTGGPLTPEREPLVVSTDALPVGSTDNRVIGHPLGIPTKIGRSVSVENDTTIFGAGSFQIKGEVEAGNSGGPVLDAQGRAIGILSKAPEHKLNSDRGCSEICYPRVGGVATGPVDCDPLQPTTDDYRPVAVRMTQLPAEFLPSGGDYNGNGTQDSVSLDVENGLIVLVGTLGGIPFRIPTPIPDAGLSAASAFASGNFNGDRNTGTGAPFDDLVVSINGLSALFLGSPSGLTLSGITLQSNRYSSFSVRDVDNDGFADLDAQRPDGQRDLYRGGPGGLLPPVTRTGFPSADERDGKFTAVTGTGLSTVDKPWQTLFIGVPVGQTNVTVEIYDGDSGAKNDIASGKTCYRLFAAPNKEVTGGSLIVATDSTNVALADSAWGALYSGPVHTTARAPSGNHFYRLEAYLAENCNGQAMSIAGVHNRFKVRTTGQVGGESGYFTFVGTDAAGPFGATQPAVDSPDHEYDGTFDFFFDVGSAGTEVVLQEFDADDLLHPDFPGIAAGANAEIRWDLFGPSGAHLTFSEIVSGDYATGGLGHVYTIPLTSSGAHRWSWTNVRAENAVHVVVPEASPTQYAIFGANVRRMTVSDAVSTAGWVQALPTTGVSPLVLGTRGECNAGNHRIVVSDVATAQSLLNAGSSAFESMRAELLAARLNVEKARGRSAELAEASVYGRDTTVAEVIAAAELAVGRGPAGTPNELLSDLARVLHAINAGEISFIGVRGSTPENGTDDSDADGIRDDVDNCTSVPNAAQEDFNFDGIGNACDPEPRVQCVVPARTGGFRAYFSFANPGPDVYLTRGSFNQLSTTGGLPLTFFPSGSHRGFQATSTGAPISWQLGNRTVTATLGSPACSGAELSQLPFAEKAVLYASHELRVADGVTVANCADIVNAGSSTTWVNATASVGDVMSHGPVFLGSNARAGVVRSNATVTLQAGAQHQGIVTSAGLPLTPLDWAVAFPAVAANHVTLEPDQSVALAPGRYRNVSVKSRATLRLQSGIYHLDQLMVEPSAIVALQVTSGPVQIYVRDNLTFRGSLSGGATGAELLLGYLGTSTAFVENSFNGFVIAPNAMLVLGTGAPQTFSGRFFARSIEARSRVSLLLPASDILGAPL